MGVFEDVTLKYLRIGHTFLPNDRAFEAIRNSLSSKYLFIILKKKY